MFIFQDLDKKRKVFYKNFDLEKYPKPVLDRFFILMYPLMFLLSLGVRYIMQIPVFL